MYNFAEKTVLVVGGAGFLASPACEEFARGGANIAVTDLNLERAQAFAAKLGADYGVPTLGIGLDVGDQAAIEECVVTTVQTFGGLDMLVNASFASSFGAFEDLTGPEFDRVAHIQLTGTFLLTRTAAASMNDGGSMVHFSSMYGSIAPVPSMYDPPEIKPNPIEYGTTKAGLEQMVRYFAVYYAPRNIRVNGVAPGSFPHAIAPSFGLEKFREFEKRLAAKCALNRIGRQHELAGPVTFLCSEAASYITGQILHVDGGVHIW